MPARKMRVELFDSEGNKYTVVFEGQMTRDKAVRLLDLVELLGGVPSGAGDGGPGTTAVPEGHTKFDKLRVAVQKSFPLVWFSSKEVQLAYEQEFKEPLGLSTVATYLARLADKGILAKSGASNSLRYKLTPRITQPQISQRTP